MPNGTRVSSFLWNQLSTRDKIILLVVLLAGVLAYNLETYSLKPVMRHDGGIPWARVETCPACLGDSCELLHRGDFREVDSNMYKKTGIVSTGRVSGVLSIAKTHSEARQWHVQRYEQFVCLMAPRPELCNPSSYILKTTMVTDTALKLPWIQKAGRIVNDEKPAFSLCLSARFLHEVKQLYVENKSTETDRFGRAFLSTSFLLNVEAVLLRYFTTNSTTSWPFPKFYAACGRVIVVEHAGKTLDNFLNAPWEVRADIAAQLLQMVDTFRNRDPDWILFPADISLQNFAVDNNGQVRLIDFDDVMVIDRRTVVNQEQDETCNEQCYVNFQKNLRISQDHCHDVLKYITMMYAKICARLLSNLQKHPELRHWGFLMEDRNDPKLAEEFPDERGLLHDPPAEISEELESALEQCVEERQPGGRLSAVLTLKRMLGTA